MNDIERDLRAFIVETFLFGNDADVPAPDASFLASGLIDSTGVLELVVFLEQRYGIEVGDADLVPENLDSINRIGAFVRRKSPTVGEPQDHGALQPVGPGV